jgi:hypothetical protein
MENPTMDRKAPLGDSTGALSAEAIDLPVIPLPVGYSVRF